jgi:hypothetical protein
VKASSSATGAAGDGKWSHAVEFTISNRPVIEPIVGATSAQPVTIRWTNMLGADSYILHLETMAGNLVVRQDGVSSNSFTTKDPLAAGNYRVWVKAVSSNPDSVSFWSYAVAFSIA